MAPGPISAISAFPRTGVSPTPPTAAGGSTALTAPASPGGEAAQAAAAPAAGLTPQQQTELETWYDAQAKTIVPVDPGGAAVLIVKFNDFQCPPCRQTYYDYKPILEKYAKLAPGKVKFVTKHYPIDPECNVNTPTGGHLASCEAAAAVVMAGTGAKAEALESWLFGNQATLTGAGVRTAARDIGGDCRLRHALRAGAGDREGRHRPGRLLKVAATPSFLVNGTMVRGGMPPPYFDALIAMELKKAAR